MATPTWFGGFIANPGENKVIIDVSVLGEQYEVGFAGEEVVEAAATHCFLVIYCRHCENNEMELLIIEIARPEKTLKYRFASGELERFQVDVKKQKKETPFPEVFPKANRHLTATADTVFMADNEGILVKLFTDEELLKKGRFRARAIGLPIGTKIVQLVSGLAHSVFLGEGGEVFTIGNGGRGELGQGPNTFVSVDAEQVEALQYIKVKQIAAGNWHSLALTKDTDDVYAWGWNNFGQLGTDSEMEESRFDPMPLDVPACEEVLAYANRTRLMFKKECRQNASQPFWDYGSRSKGATSPLKKKEKQSNDSPSRQLHFEFVQPSAMPSAFEPPHGRPTEFIIGSAPK